MTRSIVKRSTRRKAERNKLQSLKQQIDSMREKGEAVSTSTVMIDIEDEPTAGKFQLKFSHSGGNAKISLNNIRLV